MNTVTVEAFNRNIQKHKSHLQATKSGFLPLYNWQQEAFKLKDYQTVLFNTPTASGKSVLMRAIAADEHINHNRKVIIVVPAQELAKEFEDVKENRLRWQTGKTQIPEFTVTHPLYTEKIQGRIKTVKEFLKSADSGILVACNQTIIGAFSHLNKKYLDNLCILVDEAHHSSSQSYEDDDESEALSDEVNELGRVVRKCYENDVVLRFFTATFYRDDRRQVVPNDIMETTKVYDMKLHDFLQDSQLTEVENISCDIRFAKGNTNEQGGHHFALKSIWDANPDLKTAIWLSNPNKFNKVYQTECAIETLGKPIVSKAKLKRMGVTDEELEASQGTVIYLDHKGVLKRVVELSLQSVDECTPKLLKWYRGSVCERNDRENYFNKVKNDHIDACIYLNKGQEGTNWRALERAVIYEQRKLGRATQMIGRVLRKWSGKKDVCVHFVLPQMLCTTLNEDAKDKINEYVNTLWASMIIDNIIEPLFLRAKRQGGAAAPVARDQSEFDSVFALRSDEGTYLRNCAELIDQWYEGCDDKPNGRDIRKKFGEIVEGQLKSLKIEPNDVQQFVRATWQRLVVKKQEIQGKNPPVIDYDMIMNEDTPVGCAKCFYGTVMTKEFALEYKKFLDELRGVATKSLDEVKEYILSHSEITGHKTWFQHWEDYKPEGIIKYTYECFGMTQTQFFDYVFNRSKLKTLNEVKAYILSHPEIDGEKSWKKHWTPSLKHNGIKKTCWHTFNMSQKDFFDYVFDRQELMSFDEIKKYILSIPEITGPRSWKKHFEDVQPERTSKYFWKSKHIKMSESEFFNKVFDRKETKSKEEHRKLWLDNNIKSYRKDCVPLFVERNLQNEGYIQCCWSKFNMSLSEWSEYVWGKIGKKEKQDYVNYWRENKIKNTGHWIKLFNDDLESSGYVKQFWIGLGYKASEWNELVWSKSKTKEQHKDYMLSKSEITNSQKWIKHWKENELEYEGYFSNCWNQFGMTMKQWTEYVWGNVEKKSKEEHKEIWVENNVRGYPSWKVLMDAHNLSSQGYIATCWNSFDMSQKEWVEYVWGKPKTAEENRDYWIENNITGGGKWKTHWKENKDQLIKNGYTATPWRLIGGSAADWTKFVWNSN